MRPGAGQGAGCSDVGYAREAMVSEGGSIQRLVFRLIPTLMAIAMLGWCATSNRGRQEAFQAKVELVEMFMQAGYVDNPGSDIDLVRVARQAGKTGMNRVLYEGAANASLPALKWLVENGADPRDVGTLEAMPLLHRAAESPRHDRMEYFLSLGLDPLQRNREGLSVLHVAARGGLDERVLQLLLSKGLKITDATSLGQQPIHFASVKSIPVLVAAGADIEAKDINGRTPLHNAAFVGRDDIVTELLRMNASVFATDKQGRTPLHLAAMGQPRSVYDSRGSSVVDTLLAAGAPKTVRDNDNMTPGELAAAQRKGNHRNNDFQSKL